MNRHFDLYQELLENSTKYGKLFDLVVITAINSAQKACYEHQLELKRRRNRLPAGLAFRVVSDPDNHKLGSGGSTMHTLATLNEDQSLPPLGKMRVLLIHAGGYSQRAPSCSVLGKLFSSIACKHEAIEDMLDLKLSNYLPFALNPCMSPGVFLACSDEFESFDFDQQVRAGGLFGAHGNQIVLIAHRSSLQIAKDHGVYVLDQQSSSQNDPDGVIFSCKMVLQKPSIDRIRNLGIVLKDQNGAEYVHTDSVFYFTHEITKELLEFYAQNASNLITNQIEIDAYRDFLQPLGSEPLSVEDFLASQPTKGKQVLTQLYELFRDRSAIIAALHDSEFFHLGTINELFELYLNENSAFAQKFRQTLGFSHVKNTKVAAESSVSQSSCLMNCRLGQKTRVDEGSILEFCLVADEAKLSVGKNCFLSNCWLAGQSEALVPDNVCLHTFPVIVGHESKFVTIFFDRRDDLKKVYADLEQVEFLGKRLPQNVACQLKLGSSGSYTIWGLKIFRVFDSMSESLVKSVEFVKGYLEENPMGIDSDIFYSLFELLELRSYDAMIAFRQENELI